MSRLPDHLQPPAIQVAIQRMICTGCGAETNAACYCGKAYVPKSIRAAEALEQHPEKSDRAIAAELGVGKDTVRRARADWSASEAGGAYAPTEERIGRDGKSYPASKPPPEPQPMKRPTAADHMRPAKTAADGVWNEAWKTAERLNGIVHLMEKKDQVQFS